MRKRFHLLQPLPYRLHSRSAVQILLLINISIFVVLQLFPSLIQFLAINPVFFIKKYFFWSPLTYMFTHLGFTHILFNMLGLYFFGIILEKQWGSDEFLLFYLSVGVISGILSLGVYLVTGSSNIFLFGASGAVYGILLAFATLFPHVKMYVFGIFPITAKVLILIYIGMQLLSLGSGINSGVAYLTHTFGLGIAWIYLLFRHKIDPYKRLFSRQ